MQKDFAAGDQINVSGVDPTTLHTALDNLAQKGSITQADLIAALTAQGISSSAAGYLAPCYIAASGGGARMTLPGGVEVVHTFYPNEDPSTQSSAAIAAEVQLGRSFVRLPNGQWYDPPDLTILQDAQQVLEAGGDPSSFFQALMTGLTKTDLSGMAGQDDHGKLALGDIFAVAQAEGDRYAMTGDKQHSWQRDLEDAVFLGAYWAPAGGAMTEFYARGPHGSGIGDTRTARAQIGQMLGQAEAERNPQVAAALANVIGGVKASYQGNLLQQLVDYLNDPADASRANVVKNAGAITAAAVAYLKDIHDNAKELAVKVGTTLPATGPKSGP
jgi:hypothetical protein